MKTGKARGRMYPWCDSKMPYHKLPDVKELARMYFDDKLSTGEIARKFGATKGAVRKKLVRNSYSLRRHSEAEDLKANHVELTKDAWNFIEGLLLGDGGVYSDQGRPSACFQQSDSSKSYIVWLSKKLRSFGLEKSGKIRFSESSHGGSVYQFRTRYYRELKEMREKWYPEGEKILPKNLEISPNTIKNWFLGDGSYFAHSQHSGMVCSISSIMFSDEDKKFLVERLGSVKIEATVLKEGVYIRTSSHKRFFDYILSKDLEIPEAYLYKFPEGAGKCA